MTLIDLSVDAGLAATVLLTLNILFGLLLSTRYNPLDHWPRRAINIFQLHNWTGYIALAVAVAHPAFLVLSPSAGFRLVDVLVPLWSPGQDIENTVGALALYGIAFIVVTSYFRDRLGRGRWKAMHYVSYAATLLFFIHGIFTDPDLKNPAFDPLDGAKLFIEACMLLVLVATALRVRYALRHPSTSPMVRVSMLPPEPGALHGTRALIQPMGPPTRGWAGFLRIGRVFSETANVQTFRLVSPNGGELPFIFRPGQFLNLAVDIQGQRLRRSYTIASSPAQRRYCEVTVKREELGAFSPHLHQHIAEGDVLEAEGPFGQFVFDGTESRKVVLIGGGVGITPMMSMIRFLTDECWVGETVLLYACRTPADFIFLPELEQLRARNAGFRMVMIASAVEDPSWAGLRGRLTAEAIGRAVPDVASCLAFVCGPQAMMDDVARMLGQLGVPPANIRTESFGAGVPGVQAERVSLINAPPQAPLVTFARSGKAERLGRDRTLLDLAEKLRVPISGGCRMGVCGSCKVRLLSGQVSTVAEVALTPSEKAAGIILACRARATEDVSIDA